MSSATDLLPQDYDAKPQSPKPVRMPIKVKPFMKQTGLHAMGVIVAFVNVFVKPSNDFVASLLLLTTTLLRVTYCTAVIFDWSEGAYGRGSIIPLSFKG